MAAFTFAGWAFRRNKQPQPVLDQIRPLLWSNERDALVSMVKLQGWCPPHVSVRSNDTLPTVAEQLHLDLTPLTLPYGEIELFGRNAQMTLIYVQVEDAQGWLAVRQGGKRLLTVVSADGNDTRISRQLLHQALGYSAEATISQKVDQTLRSSTANPARQSAMRQALYRRHLHDAEIKKIWQVSLSAGTEWWERAQEAQLPQLFAGSLAAQLTLSILTYTIASVIGLAAFTNVIDWGWIWLVCVLLFLRLPVDIVRNWLVSVYNTLFVLLIKRRLLYGVLRLTPEETREFGTGQFLAWGLEGESLNTIGMTVANLVRSFTALVVVSFVLVFIGTPWIVAALAGWLLMAVAGGWRLYQLRFVYEQNHALMINGIMERMQGHQTRLMQEDNWFEPEDAAITQHFTLRRSTDRFEALFAEWMPISWLLIGIASLIPAFSAQASEEVAIGFAVILFTQVETTMLSSAVISLVDAIVAWNLIKPIEQAAKRPVHDGEQGIDLIRPTTDIDGQEVVTLQNIAFRYEGNASNVIEDASVNIHVGDRLLLEGPSGGGKSTLAYLLSGHYSPSKGLLFLWGLDKHTLGSLRWRKWVVYVPQFHQNHIVSASLAFNLLMGRRWPPAPEDLVEAESVCQDLGLGGLLARMPKGLQQRVGDRGWHLSHGERSRVYIARALLQGADLIILDESFASLDPENMAIALRTVLDRAKTLLVIAHP